MRGRKGEAPRSRWGTFTLRVCYNRDQIVSTNDRFSGSTESQCQCQYKGQTGDYRLKIENEGHALQERGRGRQLAGGDRLASQASRVTNGFESWPD